MAAVNRHPKLAFGLAAKITTDCCTSLEAVTAYRHRADARSALMIDKVVTTWHDYLKYLARIAQWTRA